MWVSGMKLRIKEILQQKGKTKYWLYIQLGLSYQNFNKIVNGQTSSIKFENLKAICEQVGIQYRLNELSKQARAMNSLKK